MPSGDEAGDVVVGRAGALVVDTIVVVEEDEVDELVLAATVVTDVGVARPLGSPEQDASRATAVRMAVPSKAILRPMVLAIRGVPMAWGRRAGRPGRL